MALWLEWELSKFHYGVVLGWGLGIGGRDGDKKKKNTTFLGGKGTLTRATLCNDKGVP